MKPFQLNILNHGRRHVYQLERRPVCLSGEQELDGTWWWWTWLGQLRVDVPAALATQRSKKETGWVTSSTRVEDADLLLHDGRAEFVPASAQGANDALVFLEYHSKKGMRVEVKSPRPSLHDWITSDHYKPSLFERVFFRDIAQMELDLYHNPPAGKVFSLHPGEDMEVTVAWTQGFHKTEKQQTFLVAWNGTELSGAEQVVR